ncbi:MAG: hypothetical protein EAZ78_16340 [Oscillatoriales cyanobacterium]|uniref:hypothetical protein n=1 Tax=Microcoleus anatoxicus TaxID=2705319 RepID=UPI002978081E|nr:MAG: hypothetical protein EAZ78_16340 [Oscillatoriales cyanobacterium]TAF32856.1 MAG: hypothetical protein EAZ68_20500 [Oscillatoriales cyanobacterium]TAF62649.1 MAG: hypothetical protein EAZ59_23270 [Oscillatoriales cyanobacterium]
MLSQVQSGQTKSDRTVAPTKILESRIQYKSCRIRVPDLAQPVAAILVDREYYSFFKALKEPEKVLATVAKLGNRGDSTAITKTASGYAIWVMEPEADAVSPS